MRKVGRIRKSSLSLSWLSQASVRALCKPYTNHKFYSSWQTLNYYSVNYLLCWGSIGDNGKEHGNYIYSILGLLAS